MPDRRRMELIPVRLVYWGVRAGCGSNPQRTSPQSCLSGGSFVSSVRSSVGLPDYT